MEVWSIITELRRRKVFRTAGLYVVGAWVVIQVLDLLFESWGLPNQALRYVWIAAALLFPIVLVFGWLYDITNDGIVRTPAASGDVDIRLKRTDYLILSALLVVALTSVFLVSKEVSVTPAGAGNEHLEQALEVLDQQRTVNPSGHSIAVLPFVNMSSDAEKEYFADGMTEEIITALVKVPDVSVPARTSVFGYKGHQGDIREIGLKLGVSYVLEGSVRSSGEAVRITAQLIKVLDGYQLWTQSFDRKFENIFAIQEDIAAAIAEVLVGELDINTVPNRTMNMDAYDLYLQGRALMRIRDKASVEMLTRATEADPGFAPAWAALAIAYQFEGYWHGGRETQEIAEDMARRALALDPDNVDALNALASVLRDTWNWAEAEAVFRRALAIDPESPELLEDWAEFLMAVARFEEKLEVSELGYQLDPRLQPLTDAHVMALDVAGRHDESHAIIQRFGAESGSSWFGYLWAVPTLLANGDVEAAIAMYESSPDEFPPGLRSSLIQLLKNPDDSAARDVARTYYSVADGTHLSYGNLYTKHVLVYTGDEQYVLDNQAQAFRKQQWGNVEDIWSENLRPMRVLDDFADLLQFLGLPDYWDEAGWPNACGRDEAGHIRCE